MTARMSASPSKSDPPQGDKSETRPIRGSRFSTRRSFLSACGRGAGVVGAAAALSAVGPSRIFGAAKDSGLSGPSQRWVRESIRRGIDPLCGAAVTQLTSATVISHDIYGEQLYCSADGTRIAFLRCATTDVKWGPMEICVADLNNRSVVRLGAAAFWLAAGNGMQDALFYLRPVKNGEPALVKVDFTTLEQTEIFRFGECPTPQHLGLLAISPDERYCMILRRLGERSYGVERIDLKAGQWELIHENDDIFNAHLQFSPAGGELMVQHNRGGLIDANFNGVRSTGPEGATLYVIDQDGKNQRSLSVGTPHTPPVSGHESWIAETGRVLLTTQGGRVYVATPGNKKAELIARGDGFIHISASPDGRFFVVDSIRTGRLHLGCIATGKVLPFCDSNASGGSPQYTHTHPYITPGNKRVIFNSDRTGIPQVYAATIPEEILAKLETA